MATMEAAEGAIVVPRPESKAERVARFTAKVPVHLFLLIVGLLWLVPTFGLFMISIFDPARSATEGWWRVFSDPSAATLHNYTALFQNEDLVHALIRKKTTAQLRSYLGMTGAPAASVPLNRPPGRRRSRQQEKV